MQEDQVRKSLPLLEVPNSAEKLYTGACGAGAVLVIISYFAVWLSPPLK